MNDEWKLNGKSRIVVLADKEFMRRMDNWIVDEP